MSFLPVAFHDAEAPLEQLDHGEERNGLAVGDAAAFEVDNILAEVPAELVQDPRLPDTSLGDDSDHFAAALPGSIERLRGSWSSSRSRPTRGVSSVATSTRARRSRRPVTSWVDDGRLLSLDATGAGASGK